MNKSLLLKATGLGTVILLIVNLVLFAARRISMSVFWVIIVIGLIILYVVMPAIKKL